MRYLAALAVPALFALATPAVAGTLIVAGDTTVAPFYNRPISGFAPGTLSDVGTEVNYNVVAFTVGTTGLYSLSLTSGFDNFLSLYSGAFNPGSSLANFVQADDDAGVNDNAFFSRSLNSGTSYFAVVSGFDNNDFGAYTLTIDGVGDISRGSAVPEPATWAMMIGGFGFVGGAMRRRKVSVAYA